jgi:hypothetical protein
LARDAEALQLRPAGADSTNAGLRGVSEGGEDEGEDLAAAVNPMSSLLDLVTVRAIFLLLSAMIIFTLFPLHVVGM